MPKSENQKLKLLYILKLLYEKTDEDHAVTMEQIIDYLDKNGIRAERKSIYGDINALREFGKEIDLTRGTGEGAGYRLLNREFDVPEVKLLVDAVQACKFIPENRSMKLIKQLENLCSTHEAGQLNRQVIVSGRAKTEAKQSLQNIDKIHDAIAADCRITFKYVRYDIHRVKKPSHEGKIYEVSPLALIWDNQFYYMVAFDEETKSRRNYRVDRMEYVTVRQDRPRNGRETFTKADRVDYTKQTFSMFSGKTVKVDMVFHESLMDTVVDRFGKDFMLVPAGEQHFKICETVTVSDQFFGWIFGLGGKVEITGPEEVRQQYMDALKKNMAMYQKE